MNLLDSDMMFRSVCLATNTVSLFKIIHVIEYVAMTYDRCDIYILNEPPCVIVMSFAGVILRSIDEWMTVNSLVQYCTVGMWTEIIRPNLYPFIAGTSVKL